MKDKVGTILSEKPTLLKLKSLRYKDLRAPGGRGRKSLSVNGLGIKKTTPRRWPRGCSYEGKRRFYSECVKHLKGTGPMNYIKQAFSRF